MTRTRAVTATRELARLLDLAIRTGAQARVVERKMLQSAREAQKALARSKVKVPAESMRSRNRRIDHR